MRTTRLAQDFAIRIEGVDLKTLDDAALDTIRDLWMEHRVAVFPDQALDEDDLVRFTERLGPLFVHVQTQLLRKKGRKEVMELTNTDPDERPITTELAWHTDQSYTPQPVFGTILYGIEVPEDGGETVFADLAGAWASLPADLRRTVEGITAVYSAAPRADTRDVPLNTEERARIRDCTHPLVRTHPYLGRKALYLSPMHLKSIGDRTPEESRALIDALTAHATRPAHLYVHKWRVGDLVMWDNTSVMHRRNAFGADQRRHLKRTGFYLPAERATPF